MHGVPHHRFTRRLVDRLYLDAMVLADEARSYFDDLGRNDHDALPPADRVTFSCESIKATTRLMHVIAWLLIQRAVEAGELTAQAARHPSHRLGAAPDSAPDAIVSLPLAARALIRASIDLHDRVAALDAEPCGVAESPARGLMDRLALAF